MDVWAVIFGNSFIVLQGHSGFSEEQIMPHLTSACPLKIQLKPTLFAALFYQKELSLSILPA